MTLTQKETTLLTDLKEQEKLCYQKYSNYAESAKSPELKSLFKEIATVEGEHYNTVNQMLEGTVPNVQQGGQSQAQACTWCAQVSYKSEQDKKHDEFLCKDMLAMEKHVSGLYDTSVFEFNDTQARNVLNHIQKEEQEHGDKLYKYMSANGMYN